MGQLSIMTEVENMSRSKNKTFLLIYILMLAFMFIPSVNGADFDSDQSRR